MRSAPEIGFSSLTDMISTYSLQTTCTSNTAGTVLKQLSVCHKTLLLLYTPRVRKMTAHDGYLSQGAFKDEFHDPMGYPYFAAPQSQPKQQRQEESRSCSPPDDTANCSEQLPTRPVEEYPFFAAIVRLEDGTLQMRSSRDLKRFKEYILEEAQVKLANVMDEFIGAPGMLVLSQPEPMLISYQEPLKHQLGPKRSPTTTSMRDNRLVPYPSKPGKHRNHAMYSNPERGSFLRSERKIETRQPNRGERQIQMQVDDREAQEKWFGDAFKAVQQVGCRTIAKVWIKKIHPKKVSQSQRLGNFHTDH